MKQSTPDLVIELNIECPHCEHWFDLIADTNLNDAGDLLNMALPDGYWSDEHEKFKCIVNCPKCGEWFEAKGVNW
jgi:C4-type Zn-finger protein